MEWVNGNVIYEIRSCKTENVYLWIESRSAKGNSLSGKHMLQTEFTFIIFGQPQLTN